MANAEAVCGSITKSKRQAKRTARKVAAAIEQIKQAPLRMPRHGIDREVTARKVVFNARRSLDVLGMASIGIKAVDAVGCDLEPLITAHGGNATELDTALNDAYPRSTKSLRVALPRPAAADIDIVPAAAQERIAHPAAHDPGLEPIRLQCPQHVHAGGRGRGAVERRAAVGGIDSRVR